ncbi:MAG: dihydrodipicolinate synthase family protein [Deltaproteobacteria bacterium HGW-Deltaproteobacteria-15]|jgi:4-hydroxy-2-oxoglutarate aldolase|nr:MAG: dihydrodipicolinate synthase family protein [Deltaproteobacteria bacterium HGW-Deltaproteobacteria-15]
MTKKPFAGIVPALTTPFEKGTLWVSGLKSNIEKYNRYDLAGYLVLGSTGESVLMAERESLEAVEVVRSAAKPGRIIIAGTGTFSAPDTVRLTNMAADSGADFGLVVTPFYYKGQMSAKVLEAYYREVADHTRIPIIMYNVPKFTGLDLPLDAILSLAEHPNIVGLKESSGNITLSEEIMRSCPEGFTLYQGAGSLLFPALMIGAGGGILAVADMAPGEAVGIYKAVEAGQYQKARDLQFRILTANQKIVNGLGVPGIKCAVELLGYAAGELRSPLKPVSEEQRTSVRKILEDAGLLSQ